MKKNNAKKWRNISIGMLFLVAVLITGRLDTFGLTRNMLIAYSLIINLLGFVLIPRKSSLKNFKFLITILLLPITGVTCLYASGLIKLIGVLSLALYGYILYNCLVKFTIEIM